MNRVVIRGQRLNNIQLLTEAKNIQPPKGLPLIFSLVITKRVPLTNFAACSHRLTILVICGTGTLYWYGKSRKGLRETELVCGRGVDIEQGVPFSISCPAKKIIMVVASTAKRSLTFKPIITD